MCRLTSIAKCFERVEIVSATSALTATLVKSGIAKSFSQAPYVTQSAIVAEHMLSLVCFCHKDPIILHYHFSLQLNEMVLNSI